MQVTEGSSFNYSVTGRALLRPEEVLGLGDNYLIAFVRGVPPILARRIKWFRDKDFRPAISRARTLVAWVLMAAGIAFLVWFFSRLHM